MIISTDKKKSLMCFNILKKKNLALGIGGKFRNLANSTCLKIQHQLNGEIENFSSEIKQT